MAKLIYEKDARGATLVNGKIYRIPATKDYIFKNLFGINGKEENLKGLLQAILKIKIESLQIENPEIPPQYKEDKKRILDVKEYHQIAHLKFEECTDKDEIVDDIEDVESKVVTDKLELHIIDLKKFNKINHPKGELADWLNLIKENKKLSVDKDMQEQYWYEEKTLYARNTEISVAEEKGKKQKQLEIAKKMKDKNKPIEEIIELTELSKEEIEKL